MIHISIYILPFLYFLLVCIYNTTAQPNLPSTTVLNLDGVPNSGENTYHKYPNFYSGYYPNPSVSAPQTEVNTLELVFEDDFSGNSLDPTKWNPIHEFEEHSTLHVKIGLNGPGGIAYASFADNYEFTGNTVKLIAKQMQTPMQLKCIEYFSDNTILGDGKPNKRLHKYSVGELQSNYNYKYGYYEARIKLPLIENVWPAFWLFHGSTEIDIFEMIRGGHVHPQFLPNGISATEASSKVICTYHLWDHILKKDEFEKVDINIVKPPSFFFPYFSPYPIHDKWHTWGLYWDDYQMIWILDGKVIYRIYHYVLKMNQLVYLPIQSAAQLQAVMQSHLLACLKVNHGYPREQSKIILGMNITNFNYYSIIDNNGNIKYYSHLDSDQAFTLGTLPKIMEIDYVRVYAFRNCQTNLNFCDGNDLPTHILGKSISIGSPNLNMFPCKEVVKGIKGCFDDITDCYYRNHNYLQHVRCVATEKIQLKPGFKVEKGAYFHGKIENCNTANMRTDNTYPENLMPVISQFKNEDDLFLKQLQALEAAFQENDTANFEVKINKKYLLYPNPTDSKVHLEFYNAVDEPIHITVYDIYGKEISKYVYTRNTPSLVIDLSEKSSGIYLMHILTNNNLYVERIIKK